jgi:hypothetical protein
MSVEGLGYVETDSSEDRMRFIRKCVASHTGLDRAEGMFTACASSIAMADWAR